MQSLEKPYSLLIAFLFIMIYYKFLRLESIYYFCEIDYIFKTEKWLPVMGFEGFYEVSDLGRIKSVSRNYIDINNVIYQKKDKVLSSHPNKGYLKIRLRGNNKNFNYTVHQIVSISFLNHVICGHNLVINHKNFIRCDNRVINLEIITHRENCNKKHLKSTSKYVGVYWNSQKNRWNSKIKINGRAKLLGSFVDEKEASEYYEKALINHNKGLDIEVKNHIYTSKYKGVSWDKFNNKWRSKIYRNKNPVNLGRYKTELEAIESIIKYNSNN